MISAPGATPGNTEPMGHNQGALERPATCRSVRGHTTGQHPTPHTAAAATTAAAAASTTAAAAPAAAVPAPAPATATPTRRAADLRPGRGAKLRPPAAAAAARPAATAPGRSRPNPSLHIRRRLGPQRIIPRALCAEQGLPLRLRAASLDEGFGLRQLAAPSPPLPPPPLPPPRAPSWPEPRAPASASAC
jgi:hypothetical protein